VRAHPTTHDKALRLNLDPPIYGTFAEIGAGQEVARWFFHVGGAAGTVAKTISAYDMAVSDATYGHATRYVSRERLTAMLDHEEASLVAQLGPARGDRSTFFVFANTVATRSYSRHRDGEGWLGIRFQAAPRESFSEILLHVHLRDREPDREQAALGVLGVNLIHGAFYRHGEPAALVTSLMDGLSRARVELDMIRLAGPTFAAVDNRLMSLQLVEQRFTDAAMFTAGGEVVQPSEVLHERPILVERGSFRPVTKLTLDLLAGARAEFLQAGDVHGEEPVVLMEMTLRSLAAERGAEHEDFLARVDTLGPLGNHVLISNCGRYFRLVELLSRYTKKPIGIALGARGVKEIAAEEHYADLDGGVLESFGRLFKNAIRLYVYPSRDPASGETVTAQTLRLAPPLQHLWALLLETRRLEPIRRYNPDYLGIRARDVLARIQAGDASWQSMVPPSVVEIITARGLFGYRPPREA
jgi:hypothetical protein